MTVSDPTPYRAQLVRLPLQQATFEDIAEAGRRLGLPEQVGCALGARLDQEGNLHLDRQPGRLLADAVVESLTDARARALQTSLETSYQALTTRIESTPEAVDAGNLGGHLADLARLVATVIDFAILGRFVPNALMEGLAEAGDRRPPPFPSPSSGSRLAGDLLDLYQSLISGGGTLGELAIPGRPLDHEVERELRAFADAHVGFGPLSWDRPGFEEPGHVLAAMVAAFEGGRPGGSSAERPEGPSELPTTDARPAQVLGRFPVEAARRLLAAWLAFLDQETWYVRRAFFLGIAPVLRGLVAEHRRDVPEIRPGDVLFCTSPHQPTADPGEWLPEAKARRAAYLEDRRYLASHGIDERRLDALVRAVVGVELSAAGDLFGLGAAPGRAAGPVMLVGGASAEPVPPGAVLVARILHPHLAPLLFRAAAVVVEEGALLQHATVLAREFGIPAVVAVEGATSALAAGEWVEVDGDAGVVRRPASPQ